MPTRSEIQDALSASQETIAAFFHGLSPEDLVRPCTASGVPGEAPWRAKDHYAHLAQNERTIQMLLRLIQSGQTEIPGNPGAMSTEERIAMGNQRNQSYVNAHRNDPMESLAADIATARRETLQLLDEFTDAQLAAPVSLSLLADRTAGELFAGNAQHAGAHMTWVAEGLLHPPPDTSGSVSG